LIKSTETSNKNKKVGKAKKHKVNTGTKVQIHSSQAKVVNAIKLFL
jgi:hypothetical protein